MFVRFLTFVLFGLGVIAAHAAQTMPLFEAEGTQLRATLADGRVVHSPQLIGATLLMATSESAAARVRLDAIEADPDDKTGKVWLHTFSVQDANGTWQPLCSPGPDGRRQGFPLSGRANIDGSVAAASASEVEIVCTSGARGKCVRFGYHPWEQTPNGTSLLPIYNACIRMVRADYGGTGHPYTRNGMRIDLYDDFDIQRADAHDTMPFEAGWSETGAVCVAHPRVPDNGSLEQLAVTIPRLVGRTGPQYCTEQEARALGAILFNRSAVLAP